MIKKGNKRGEIILGQEKGKETDEDWVLSIGDSADKKKRNVKLSITSPHIIFVCGTRGSGKSYTLGVIAEEIAKRNPDVGVVILDPIGVFWSMKYPNQEKDEIELLKKREMEPEGMENVQVLVPTGYKSEIPEDTFDLDFSFKASNLKVEDWCLTFGIDRYSPQGLLLERAIEKTREGYTRKLGDSVKGGSRDVPPNDNFSIDDLIDCINHDREILSKEKGFKGSTRRALTSRLTAAKDWGIFGKERELSDMINPGEVTVLDISFLSENIGSLVLGILARKILAARKAAAREEAVRDLRNKEEKRSGSIPPTWLMVDEAHSFAPSSGNTAATKPLIEYVKQGRRPGLSAVLSTQQPSALNSKIISQLDILLSHRLSFENDIREVRKRIPTGLPNDLKEPDSLKRLPEGSALTADKETKMAFITNIRPRLSQHEGRERVTKASGDDEPETVSITKEGVTETGEEIQGEEEITQEEYPGRSEEVLAVPVNVSFEEAEELAEEQRKRFLSFLWSSERVRKISKKYYPIWSALIDYHTEEDSINLRIQMDALTGELIKKPGRVLERTRGVRSLPNIKKPHIDALFEIIRSEALTYEKLEKSLSNNKRVRDSVDSLVEKEFIEESESEGKMLLRTRDGIDIPRKLSERSLMAAEEIPERESKIIPTEEKIDRVISEEEMLETLELFGDIELIERELFYYPYWIAEIVNQEGSRILALDGVLGDRDRYAENMLRRRVF